MQNTTALVADYPKAKRWFVMVQLGGTSDTLRTTGRWQITKPRQKRPGWICGGAAIRCHLGSGDEGDRFWCSNKCL